MEAEARAIMIERVVVVWSGKGVSVGNNRYAMRRSAGSANHRRLAVVTLERSFSQEESIRGWYGCLSFMSEEPPIRIDSERYSTESSPKTKLVR